ncbi:MAG: hypothetical protein M3290_01335 [Actinomycetota bacterium]|nr:hypothetical protein [Actinomycetota bacterium]
MLRKILITFVSAALLAVPHPAHARPRSSSYCSTDREVCQSVGKVSGVRWLQIRTAGMYFARYRLCVTAPDHSRSCHRFRMFETRTGGFASSIRWRRHFPTKGSGEYSVTWKLMSGNRIGRRLNFHR